MKKTIRRIVPAMLVLVALATLSFMAKDGVTLRLKPQQGKTYTVTTKANAMSMIEVQGQTINSSQAIESRQTYNAQEVTNEQIVFETEIEAIKMTISQMGMKLEYDSEHPEKTSPLLAGQVDELTEHLKAPYNVTYDAMGNLIGDDLKGGGNFIIQLPKQEVVVGSKWNTTQTQSISGTDFTVNMEYTVTAISKKSVDLSFTGDVNTDEVTGTYSGTASINPQTGLVMSSTMKSNVSMTVEAEGMVLPITVVGTTTLEVK